jgi:AraC family transcriptional regulator, transcriptional activator FtrA
MRSTKNPCTSRGRDKHVIAMLIVADTVALEVAVAQQIFGPPMPTLAAVTGDASSPYEVILCGERPRYVLPSGTDVGELAPLEALLSADTIIVPGVQDPLATRSDALLATLRTAAEAGIRMVSFCGGAFLLGYAGILDSRRVTTHWILAKEFREAFPRVRLDADQLYVDDGPVHTSGGLFSATDLSLHLVALDRGQAYANDTGRILVSAPHRPGGQAQFVKDAIRNEEPSPMSAFLRWLREHIDEPLSLAELASHEHVSERTLIRNFRQATGMSVYDWITRERVNRSKVLLETTDFRVGEIAAMVGFGTAETLRRNFVKVAGTTAGAYRATFIKESELQPAS